MEFSALKCFLLLIIMIANQTIAKIRDDRNFCEEEKCGENEPPIKFPFWLKSGKSHPNNGCGFPGFDLICAGNKTMQELPSQNSSIFVRKIDYKSQEIRVYGQSNCFTKSLLFEFHNRSLIDPTFRFKYNGDNRVSRYTLLKCPTRDEPCRTIMVRSDSEIQGYHGDVVSCSKVRDFEAVPDEIYRLLWQGYTGSDVVLTWFEPDCRHCEAKGQGCRLMKIGAGNKEIECFERTKEKSKFSLAARSTTIAITVSLFVLLVFGTIFCLYNLKKKEKADHERIEQFLDDYNSLKPSRYSYADIKKITNQFEEILGQGANGTVYKGKLSNEVLVAVKILHNISKGNGEEFINEVATMMQIYHVNVVRLVGYCADGFIRALIFEFLPNGSLEKYISAESSVLSLDWKTLHDIALGIAKGIEYLHQGCDKRILHFDIKPRNVLLDGDFIPKISDFGLAKLVSKDKSVESMNTARGTMGYIAPEVFSRNFGNVSYKSDVYSFGMLLLEMVGKRKNTNPTAGKEDEVYYPEWIYNLLEGGEDLRILVDKEESNAKIAKKLAIIGLWCIQWYAIDRPTMKLVVRMLEGDKDLDVPPNPFGPSSGSKKDKRERNMMTLEFETIAE